MDNPALLQQLAARGVYLRDMRQIDGHLIVEPPVSIMGGQLLDRSEVGAFTFFSSGFFSRVNIGRYCSFANGVSIEGDHPTDWLTTHPFPYKGLGHFNAYAEFQNFQVSPGCEWRTEQPPTRIGHDVWIGRNAFIKAGVVIGNGAVVGANAVVTRDIPPYSIVVGSPARVIRLRFPETTIERLMALAWWQFHFKDLEGVPFNDIDAAIGVIEERVARGMLTPYTPRTIILQTA